MFVNCRKHNLEPFQIQLCCIDVHPAWLRSFEFLFVIFRWILKPWSGLKMAKKLSKCFVCLAAGRKLFTRCFPFNFFNTSLIFFICFYFVHFFFVLISLRRKSSRNRSNRRDSVFIIVFRQVIKFLCIFDICSPWGFTQWKHSGIGRIFMKFKFFQNIILDKRWSCLF